MGSGVKNWNWGRSLSLSYLITYWKNFSFLFLWTSVTFLEILAPNGEKFLPRNQMILQMNWKLHLPSVHFGFLYLQTIKQGRLQYGVVNSSYQEKFGYFCTEAVRKTRLRPKGIHWIAFSTTFSIILVNRILWEPNKDLAIKNSISEEIKV